MAYPKNILFEKKSKNAIGSVEALCNTLGVTAEDLKFINNLSDEDKYKLKKIPKSDGKERVVYNPHSLLRKIQRRINNRIFSPKKETPTIIWPYYLYGSLPNQEVEDEIQLKDYIACAKNHCLSKSLLKLDIENFFDNIHEDIVKDIFLNFFNFPTDVSDVLTKICCYHGTVVQGALTSSYIASLCLFDIEPKIVRKIERKKLHYTRLVDDITISSHDVNYDFSYVKSIIIDMLHEKDLPVNNEKTKVYKISSSPLIVHGLRVSFKEPRLPSDEISRIRASVKNIEILSSEPKYRVSSLYRHDFNRCMGRVNKLARLGHNQHKNLLDRLKKIYPLPSKKDIKRSLDAVCRLENDYENKKQTYWYWKRFHFIQENLNRINITYPSTAKKLRTQLKEIKPTYKG